MQAKRSLNISYVLLLLLQLTYSFFQHYGEPLDGDMAGVILPTKAYVQVLEDPLGWSVIKEGRSYAGPNRYAVHQSMYTYFRTVPFFLQKIVDPISSVYLACALFKLSLQVLLLYLLATYIRSLDWKQPISLAFVALLICPFFQHSIYNSLMGMILSSITYTFSYTFPLVFLLLFAWPFYRSMVQQKPLKEILTPFHRIGLLLLLLFLTFSGPLIAPLALMICPLILIWQFYIHYPKEAPGDIFFKASMAFRSIPKDWLAFMSLFVFCSLYAFYLGLFNAESDPSVPVFERYALLSKGVFQLLTNKPGWLLCLLFIAINVLLVRKYRGEESSNRLLLIGRGLLLFAVCYLLLLPLGGYRSYRPFIIRADTLMPLTLLFVYYYGVTTLYLLGQLKMVYRGAVLLFSILLLIANEPHFDKNQCERAAFLTINQSTEKTVELGDDCKTVMSWVKVRNPKHSRDHSRLLHLWGVLGQPKAYYQSPSSK